MHFTFARILRRYLRPRDLFFKIKKNKGVRGEKRKRGKKKKHAPTPPAVLKAKRQSAREGGTNKTNASFKYAAE